MKLNLHPRLMGFLRRRSLRASLAERTALQLYYYARFLLHKFPVSSSERNFPAIYDDWWYYNIELLPDQVTNGQYSKELPFLPRMLMRNCELSDMDCLDIGTMEGLMATLMCRQGARNVTATDAWFHCYKKICAVRHYYNADFSFRYIGNLYDLSKRISLFGKKSFDFINLSGVLYHAFSPMHVLAGVRPLLKKNGLMIISTNIIERSDHSMEFNNSGKLNPEINSFWYLSVPCFDYMLKYFRLEPIDFLYHPDRANDQLGSNNDINTGYLSVVCRATDSILAGSDDDWIAPSIQNSWENTALCDEVMLSKQSSSLIRYRKPLEREPNNSDDRSIDLQRAIKNQEPIISPAQSTDSHILHLKDEF